MEELRADDPRWIGSYRLLGRLGAGGMGRVFLARSERGRTVAVKLVRAELAAQEEFRTRFRREVRAARRVGGAWTAPVLDADTEAEVPWVATGYVAGPSLQHVVAKEYGPLPERSVRVLAAGLAHALADIHAAGLVHRDLKPSNVMITIDGPRVIDFGIARALETVADDGTLTYTGAMVGSPAFMSPEQVRGDRVTPACDIFCMGSVLAFAATGLQPFGAASSGVHAQMFRIVQEPPALDAVPAGLRDLVAACLTKEPELRPSLAEVRERVGAIPAEADGRGAEGGDGDQGGRDGQGGADGRGGEPWLPGGIVARLGRHAVRLLELETADTASLPVLPASAERVGAGARAASASGAGGSGAGGSTAGGSGAGSSVAQPAGPGPEAAAGDADRPGAGTPEPVRTDPVQAEQAQAPAQAPPLQTEPPPSRPAAAESVTTVPAPLPLPAPTSPTTVQPRESEPPAGARRPAGRGRRGVLVAALALLAVIAGATTAFVAVRENGQDDGRPRTKAVPSAAARTARTPTAGGAPGSAVPDGLVGTWTTSFDSGTVGNERTLTIRGDGSVLLDGKSPDYACTWSMRITAAGPPTVLSPSEVTRAEPASLCDPGGATSLTLLDPTHLRRDNLDSDKAPLTYLKVG